VGWVTLKDQHGRVTELRDYKQRPLTGFNVCGRPDFSPAMYHPLSSPTE